MSCLKVGGFLSGSVAERAARVERYLPRVGRWTIASPELSFAAKCARITREKATPQTEYCYSTKNTVAKARRLEKVEEWTPKSNSQKYSRVIQSASSFELDSLHPFVGIIGPCGLLCSILLVPGIMATQVLVSARAMHCLETLQKDGSDSV